MFVHQIWQKSVNLDSQIVIVTHTLLNTVGPVFTQHNLQLRSQLAVYVWVDMF